MFDCNVIHDLHVFQMHVLCHINQKYIMPTRQPEIIIRVMTACSSAGLFYGLIVLTLD